MDDFLDNMVEDFIEEMRGKKNMDEKETQEILDELYAVRPEMLNDKAKRLFEAIMKIADERDELKKENEKLKEYKFMYEDLCK